MKKYNKPILNIEELSSSNSVAASTSGFEIKFNEAAGDTIHNFTDLFGEN